MTASFMSRLKTSLPRYGTALAALLLLCVGRSFGDGVVDQSFTTGNNAIVFINGCCAFIGQTYTAGLTGTLAGVSVDVVEFPSSNFPLDVQIRSVVIGLPTAGILGETTATVFTLSDFISFSQTIPQVAGDQYAIVVDFVGAPPQGGGGQGYWIGSTSLYPGRMPVLSSDGGISWSATGFGDTDSHFITYVSATVPEPGSALLLVLGAAIVGIALRHSGFAGYKEFGENAWSIAFVVMVFFARRCK